MPITSASVPEANVSNDHDLVVMPRPWYAQLLLIILGNQAVGIMLPTLMVVGFVCFMYYKQSDDVLKVTGTVSQLTTTVSQQTVVLQEMRADISTMKDTARDSLRELEHMRRQLSLPHPGVNGGGGDGDGDEASLPAAPRNP
jgi:hypothetical protein